MTEKPTPRTDAFDPRLVKEWVRDGLTDQFNILSVSGADYERLLKHARTLEREIEELREERDHERLRADVMQRNASEWQARAEAAEQRLKEDRLAAYLTRVREQCVVDDNGDPVEAQPETQWESGYCAGIRHAYRIGKEMREEAHGTTSTPDAETPS